MRLYPKKIHNLQELREERLELKRAARENGDIFSMPDKKSKKKNKGKEEEQDEDVAGWDMGGILGAAIGNKGTLAMILSTGLPIVLEMIPRQTKIKFFRKVIGEFAEAYVGWKAVKLGYNIVQSLFKTSPKPTEAGGSDGKKSK